MSRLVAEGYASQIASDRGRYTATRKLVALAGTIVARSDIGTLAAPHVSALQAKTGLTAYLSVGTDARVTDILYDDGSGPHSIDLALGALAVQHSVAAGRVLLAFRPELAARMLSGAPGLFTIDDPSKFLLELAQIRRQGYIVDRTPNGTSLATPVFDHNGHVVAAFSVSTTAIEVDVEMLRGLLQEEAAALSESLGYGGNSHNKRTVARHNDI